MSKPNCPHCAFVFQKLAVNGPLPDIAPILCEQCLQISLWENRSIRKLSEEELEAVKQSEGYKVFLEPVIRLAMEHKQKGAAKA